ncbi:MAG TPA: hypothetical protein VK619_10980, partial [Pyrinomonadaceae bacterium]|nr:hypothetical protein [Pyrinomonadaceae bacterium]
IAFDYFRNHTHQNATAVEQQPANAPATAPPTVSQATQPAQPQINVAPQKVEERQATVPAKPKSTPDERADGGDGGWTGDEPGAGARAAKRSKAERRRRNDEYGPEEVQRQMERAGRELNRIREIFEGRQQTQQPPER